MANRNPYSLIGLAEQMDSTRLEEVIAEFDAAWDEADDFGKGTMLHPIDVLCARAAKLFLVIEQEDASSPGRRISRAVLFPLLSKAGRFTREHGLGGL